MFIEVFGLLAHRSGEVRRLGGISRGLVRRFPEEDRAKRRGGGSKLEKSIEIEILR